MDFSSQKGELVDIMTTMDECMVLIKRALDKLEFNQMNNLVAVLTEAFLAVNNTVDGSTLLHNEQLKLKFEYDIKNVNRALEGILASYDSHDMEVRLSSYNNLKSSMLIWTGHIFDVLQLA